MNLETSKYIKIKDHIIFLSWLLYAAAECRTLLLLFLQTILHTACVD
jgi:hypothetical protein